MRFDIIFQNNIESVWLEPSHEEFSLRQPNYSFSKKKDKSTPPGYRPIMAKVIGFHTKITHLASRIKCIRDFVNAHPETDFMIIVRQVPTNYVSHVIFLYARSLPRGEDAAFDRLHDQFLSGGDDFRKERFKYLPQLPTAPFMVKNSLRALGGHRPVLIGNGYLLCHYFTGKNYFEVNIDISSSAVAKTISGTIVSRSEKVVIDEGFVIEGRSEDELPERLLGCHRFVYCDLKGLTTMVTESDLLPIQEADGDARAKEDFGEGGGTKKVDGDFDMEVDKVTCDK